MPKIGKRTRGGEMRQAAIRRKKGECTKEMYKDLRTMLDPNWKEPTIERERREL